MSPQYPRPGRNDGGFGLLCLEVGILEGRRDGDKDSHNLNLNDRGNREPLRNLLNRCLNHELD